MIRTMRFGVYLIKQIKYYNSQSYGIFRHLNTHSKWVKVRIENMPPHRENPVIMKLDSPEFHSIFTPELNTLVDLFKKYNYEIRVAGGAVRDILMNIKPKDLDFATTATPNEMKEIFTKEEVRMINNKGEKHGTITARINDKENFEVTTLRVDLVTDGRHAEVEFTRDWKLDSNRRDLTINSMFLDFEGNVYDYFYGHDDLKKQRIAFVGDTATRIQEDFLRILRYFRFYGRIAEKPNNHEQKTLDIIRENVGGMEPISGERIWSELKKILEGNYSMELMTTMIDCKMAKYMGLPEKPDVETFTQVCRRARNNEVTLKPMTLLAALLRDLEEVKNLDRRLKFSNYDRELLMFIVPNRVDKPCEKRLKPYQHLVIHSKMKVATSMEYVMEVLKYRGDIDLLEEFQNWVLPRFPVNGYMLKPLIKNQLMFGIVMIKLKNIWLDHEFQISADDLMTLVSNIVSDIEENGTLKNELQEKETLKKKFKNK